VPWISSVLFLIVISAPIASAALFAKNNPKPAPCAFPTRLNGAKRSISSCIPIPSSKTSIDTVSLIL